MSEAKFKFISEAGGGDQFTVIGFTGNEAISTLYQYEIEIKAPLTAEIELDDILDSPAQFVTEINGLEYPVYGILSSLDEMQTVQGYTYYRAVLVPRLWRLSIYKTNEIYTEEKTVNKILETVLEAADLFSGTDFDLKGLDDSHFLQRDYVCQFGESDFDFISRIMENEGIFYYFDHGNGVSEKIIFINDMNYLEIPRPGLFYDVAAQASKQHDCIHAWSCRKQRLAASVTVRDFNPDQPSLDISDTMPVDDMGQGTEYLYGENIIDGDEATYLAEIRAEERLCQKTRYYGEGAVTRLQAGYLFALDGHPNPLYNGIEYLVTEVNHEGRHLDMSVSADSKSKTKTQPQYQNNFVAIDASVQFRPGRKTPRPRFYGTMTAFIYAEVATMNAEIDEFGRYRVQLPFDRADGTMSSV
ncbi:MAG: type VI secretion system tip protein VgrG, partial [Gammaproteobacteria bacterium]|nr:type VI secretion system tip protein VgrG [Gammaproteobacteria bacterium]